MKKIILKYFVLIAMFAMVVCGLGCTHRVPFYYKAYRDEEQWYIDSNADEFPTNIDIQAARGMYIYGAGYAEPSFQTLEDLRSAILGDDLPIDYIQSLFQWSRQYQVREGVIPISPLDGLFDISHSECIEKREYTFVGDGYSFSYSSEEGYSGSVHIYHSLESYMYYKQKHYREEAELIPRLSVRKLPDEDVARKVIRGLGGEYSETPLKELYYEIDNGKQIMYVSEPYVISNDDRYPIHIFIEEGDVGAMITVSTEEGMPSAKWMAGFYLHPAQ